MNRTAFVMGLVLAGVAAATAGTASAQGYRSGKSTVDVRQDNQKNRIAAGIRNGDLNRGESRRLVDQQRSIADYERRAKADGRLDRSERVQINRMQNHASRSIWRMRHNDRGRRYGFYRSWRFWR